MGFFKIKQVQQGQRDTEGGIKDTVTENWDIIFLFCFFWVLVLTTLIFLFLFLSLLQKSAEPDGSRYSLPPRTSMEDARHHGSNQSNQPHVTTPER